jgi:hypothetical protein
MFLYSHWLSTPLATRNKIAKQFGIIKRGHTEVVDNFVKSDGYQIKEVEAALNFDALRAYLETEEKEPQILWNMLIDKVEGRVSDIPVIKQVEPVIKKRGRPAKTK